MEEQYGTPLRRSNSLKLARNKHKVKISNDDNLISYKEQLGSSSLSKKSEIAEVLELCFQPITRNELGKILFTFWERLTGDPSINKGDICEFDAVCMYALDYVYEHDTMPFPTVSKSLFVYDIINRLNVWERNVNVNLKCGCFLNKLRQFTDFHTYSKSEETLVNICLGCIATGNLGLALYLVKFELIDFPTEVNEKFKTMFSILVYIFNRFSSLLDGNLQLNNKQISFRLEELLNKVKENKINSRRSILIFCILIIVTEYKMYDELEMKSPRLKIFTGHRKDMCFFKLNCVDLFLEASTETIITSHEIEYFIELFLNPFLTAHIRKSLVDTYEKILQKQQHYFNTRSLQYLARVKVRSNLKYPTSIPEQVSALKLPVAMKEFLNFCSGRVWGLLVANHINNYLERQFYHPMLEVQERNEQAIEDGNVRELEEEISH